MYAIRSYYDHGWQIQPKSPSIQEDLQRALSTICREEIAVTGAGRTDTGVHANYYVAHFDSGKDQLDNPQFVYKLNSFLRSDIVIFVITSYSIHYTKLYDFESTLRLVELLLFVQGIAQVEVPFQIVGTFVNRTAVCDLRFIV